MLQEAPFVLSEDAYVLMKSWSVENRRKIPGKAYFADITASLKNNLRCLFDSVVVAESDRIIGFARDNIDRATGLLSLDRAYADKIRQRNGIVYLDRCRGLDTARQPIPAMRPEKSADKSRRSFASYALFDDVIFDGNAMIDAVTSQRPDFALQKIIAGVSTTRGKAAVENATGLPVKSAYEFSDIIDEVCERDFLPGTPLSGRPVFTDDAAAFYLGSMPYIQPFGDPEKWASIPENCASLFSYNCMEMTTDLWSEINRLNKIDIKNRDLPRMIYGLDYNASVVPSLSRLTFTRR